MYTACVDGMMIGCADTVDKAFSLASNYCANTPRPSYGCSRLLEVRRPNGTVAMSQYR